MFFLKVNKTMPFGGALGADKFGPLSQLPNVYVPNTLLLRTTDNFDKRIQKIANSGNAFPFIVKPNNGERGKGVCLISDEHALHTYVRHCQQQELLVQAYVDFPLEFGVFFYRDPDGNAHIPSLVQKEFLTVLGDGKSSIAQLLKLSTRAQICARSLLLKSDELEEVLPENVIRCVEFIGNHSRGTKFLNANHLVNEKMIATFDKLAQHLPGFEYGRFDLKAKSINSLYTGEGIKVVEVNGVNAEPGHIYDPAHGLFRAYKDLFKHMHIIYTLAKQNHNTNAHTMSFGTFLQQLRKHSRPLA